MTTANPLLTAGGTATREIRTQLSDLASLAIKCCKEKMWDSSANVMQNSEGKKRTSQARWLLFPSQLFT
jgi:hypothetical protein